MEVVYLIDLDILEREVPVTESNPEKSKKSFYKIRDNFLQFWFRFIYPNRSYIESGNQSIVMSKLKKNFIDNHVSFVYEEICRKRGFLLRGNDFDYTRCAAVLLDEFRSGKIGRISLEVPDAGA